jgi:hypothetical protein
MHHFFHLLFSCTRTQFFFSLVGPKQPRPAQTCLGPPNLPFLTAQAPADYPSQLAINPGGRPPPIA